MLLGSLSPELVTCTAVNSYGSVLQDAVLERKTDFIRILLDHGVDPTIGIEEEEKTPVQLAEGKDSYKVITLLAEYGHHLPGQKIKEKGLVEVIGSFAPSLSPLVLLICLIVMVVSVIVGILITVIDF